MALAFVQEAKGTASGSYHDSSPPLHCLGYSGKVFKPLEPCFLSENMRNVAITSWNCCETEHCDLDKMLSTMQDIHVQGIFAIIVNGWEN